MREKLLNLIDDTIIYEYDLPNKHLEIPRSVFSNENDKCYSAKDANSLAEIIYNSVIEYSFNEYEIQGKDYENLHAIALKAKLKYNEKDSETSKIKYGFHGETLLFCILYRIFGAKPVISRGYFYNPLERAETKGYDAYHIIENGDHVELWFGEVKFSTSSTYGIKSALGNLEKAISDKYFETNILAMYNHKNCFNIKGTAVEKIINAWEENPTINIIKEAEKYKMKLVYPMFMLYEKGDKDYDVRIKESIEYVKKTFPPKALELSIDYSIYFIWMPISEVKRVKETVIKCIESKKQLL